MKRKNQQPYNLPKGLCPQARIPHTISSIQRWPFICLHNLHQHTYILEVKMTKRKSEENPLGALGCVIGKGLFCGFFATAVMTLAQQIEMNLTGRSGSDTPARAGATVLGVTPVEEKKNRFNYMVHFFYGTVWGTVVGIMSLLNIRKVIAALLHFLSMWITGMIILPSLKASSPPWKWGAKGIATDGLFHVIFSLSATYFYSWLERKKSKKKNVR
ncbi:hypothetical protein CHISP_1244 [Chitinispirillum alkaliphilum]|nr:hypothetical protein CHISP_1244 [Chitinispirillum alkaliphilum]